MKNNKKIGMAEKDDGQNDKTKTVEIQPMKTPIEPAVISTVLISPFLIILS